MKAEEWRPAYGYEGLYEVSDLGRVRGVVKGIVLRPNPARHGYLQVTLCQGGRRRTIAVHRLVLASFSGPFAVGEESNHLNGRKDDNRLANLEKVSRLGNVRHAIGSGLYDPKANPGSRGESNP